MRRRKPSGRADALRRARRLVDSPHRRRRRSLLGLGLLAVGTCALVFGIVAWGVPPPEPTQLATNGPTAVPRTYFFQDPWVLFGDVPDPRRVPAPAQVGCQPIRDISIPEQPVDMTRFGSRVVDGQPLSAMLLFSRSGGEASVDCARAVSYRPLWLMPASPAPPFTPAAIVIAAVLLLVAGGIVHPGTASLRLPDRRQG